MAMIFPFILAIIISLIFYTMIELQVEMTGNICEKYGLNLVKSMELSGIDNYEDSTNSADSKKYFSEVNPYRHILSSNLSVNEEELRSKLSSMNIIEGKYEVSITNNRVGFFKVLEISVAFDYDLPLFTSYFDIILPSQNVSKRFCNIDKGEIVRNTDYIYELGDMIFEKYDIYEKLNKFGVKIKDE